MRKFLLLPFWCLRCGPNFDGRSLQWPPSFVLDDMAFRDGRERVVLVPGINFELRLQGQYEQTIDCHNG